MNDPQAMGRVKRRRRRPRFVPELPRRASSRKFGDVEDAMIEWIDQRRGYYAKPEPEVKMANSKGFKKRIRELQEVRGCAYMVAMRELEQLPEGTNLEAYIEQVRANVAAGVPQ